MTAIILDDANSLMVGGLPLAERAALAAHRAGLDDVVIVGDAPPSRDRVRRLLARGATARHLTWAEARQCDKGPSIVIGSGVLLESRALATFVERARAFEPDTTVLAGPAEAPHLILLPRGSLQHLEACGSWSDLVAAVRTGPSQSVDLEGRFVRRVEDAHAAAQAETDYIRHLNGRESYFTKKIRRFSVPVSRVLARLDITPTQVTLAGLVLACGSALLVSIGTYQASLLGALLYYASMVLDCSDGEVARLSFRDSAFGAWLETVVDYTSYFLLLAGLTIGSSRRYGDDAHQEAAVIGLVGSIVVVVVASYLRQRVAGADPGQFDDASAAALRRSGRFHRFARWGRQWIKRSTIAHLVVALALVNQLPFLIYLWAFGGVVASIVIVGVEPFIVRRVKVDAPPRRT